MNKTKMIDYSPKAFFSEGGVLEVKKNIPLSQIILKEGDEFWYKQSQETRSDKMVEFMKTGGVLPRINVFGKRFEGDKYQLYDGHSRFMAYKKMKKKMIPAIITLVNKDGQSYFDEEIMIR